MAGAVGSPVTTLETKQIRANKGTDAWDPGGVWGMMIDAQSIVVASTATGWYGYEGSILRYVFIHSMIHAALVGVLVFLQAYVWPVSQTVP